jgi:hypothetical protein
MASPSPVRKTYSVQYSPAVDKIDTYHTVLISHLPESANLAQALALVQGGPLISSILVNTSHIPGGSVQALVEFCDAETARNLVMVRNMFPVILEDTTVTFQVLKTPTHPKRLSRNRTRCLKIEQIDRRAKDAIAADMRNHLLIISVVAFDYNEDSPNAVFIDFSTVLAANQFVVRATTDRHYRSCTVEYVKDPCDISLHTFSKKNESFRQRPIRYSQWLALDFSKVGCYSKLHRQGWEDSCNDEILYMASRETIYRRLGCTFLKVKPNVETEPFPPFDSNIMSLGYTGNNYFDDPTQELSSVGIPINVRALPEPSIEEVSDNSMIRDVTLFELQKAPSSSQQSSATNGKLIIDTEAGIDLPSNENLQASNIQLLSNADAMNWSDILGEEIEAEAAYKLPSPPKLCNFSSTYIEQTSKTVMTKEGNIDDPST